MPCAHALNGKYLIVRCAEDSFEQDDFVGIEMPLPDFDFRDRAPRDVAAVDLHFDRKQLLRHARPLAQTADIFTDLSLCVPIHTFAKNLLTLL